MYVFLSDGEFDESFSSKKWSKMETKTKQLFDKCLERHKESKALSSSAAIGVVEGGRNLKLREKWIGYLKDKDVFGYSISGLHHNGEEVKDLKFEDIEEIVQHTLVGILK